MCQRLAEAVVGGAWQDNNTLCSAVCSRERQDCHVTGSMELLYCNTPTHTHTHSDKVTHFLRMCVKSPSVHSLVLGSSTPYRSSLDIAWGGGG